jgi:hypothetical protein
MRPSVKEYKAILVAECHQSIGVAWLFCHVRFWVKRVLGKYKTSEIKNLEALWESYGISRNQYLVTDEEKIQLIHKWVLIFYGYEGIDMTSYQSFQDWRRANGRAFTLDPGFTISFDMVLIYLSGITEQFGPYDKPRRVRRFTWELQLPL